MNSHPSLPAHLRAPRGATAAFTGLVAAFILSAATGRSAPLTETTAVLTRPDPSAPVIMFLKAGSEPAVDASASGTPDGWTAVGVTGPFEGYVQNADLTKGLDVKPGSSIYVEPKSDAGVLATAAKGDPISITGLRGKWTQIKLDKTLIGYIHPGPLPSVGLSAGIPQTNAAPEQAPVANAPAVSTEPGRPVQSDATAGQPHRFFQGKLLSSNTNPLVPHRPYDWQLVDATGRRLIYLDVSKLLLTEQIDNYAGRTVEVFGPVLPVTGSSDIVVVAESLQLR